MWALAAPRSLWRVAVGWSTTDPDRSEPGDAVHGVVRGVAFLGLVAVAAVAIAHATSTAAAQPRPAAAVDEVEQMWGRPAPRLIDRLVIAGGGLDAGYPAGPVLAYQAIERGDPPDYLVSLSRWTFLGTAEPAGILGAYPGDGYTAYGTSSLIVEAAGPLACIPRSASVIESESDIRVAVAWGLPGAAEQDHAAACTATEGATLQKVLIPVQLSAPVGDREVTTLEGTPIVEIIAAD